LDRAAGAAARALLGWAVGRLDPSRQVWIHALRAEADEIDGGWARLAWAVGGLRLVWTERRRTMRHRWRARLRWLGSAGGLGGLRVYSPGVVCGIVMSVWSFWQRNVDLPVPLIAVLMFVPCYGLAGFWTARKRSVEVGTVVGAVTAVLGFVILSLTMIVYAAGTEPWLKPVAYILFSLTFLIPAAFVGATGGLIGGALAHSSGVRASSHRRR
jgi:hypothetical protein